MSVQFDHIIPNERLDEPGGTPDQRSNYGHGNPAIKKRARKAAKRAGMSDEESYKFAGWYAGGNEAMSYHTQGDDGQMYGDRKAAVEGAKNFKVRMGEPGEMDKALLEYLKKRPGRVSSQMSMQFALKNRLDRISRRQIARRIATSRIPRAVKQRLAQHLGSVQFSADGRERASVPLAWVLRAVQFAAREPIDVRRGPGY